MLDVKEARLLGNKKCMELFGESFCERYADFGGRRNIIKEDKVRCFYGMNDNESAIADNCVLTEVKYRYHLTLDVSRSDGEVSVVESCLPADT